MPLMPQPCNGDEEVIAMALVAPEQLQDILPIDACWAFVLDENNHLAGVLMWERGLNMPTEIEIAPTMIDATYPNENLYWGVK